MQIMDGNPYDDEVCMMFVGFRMRVLQLSKGTGNPQDWVRMSMQAVTYSILANTLLVLFVPLFTAKEIKTTKEGDLDPKGQAPFENSALATIFNVVRYPERCISLEYRRIMFYSTLS